MSTPSTSTLPRRRSWLWFSLLGLVLVIAVLAVLLDVPFLPSNYLPFLNGAPAAEAAEDALNFAEVVRTDLVQEETLDGTLGFLTADPVTTQLPGTITEIAPPGATMTQGDVLFAINNQPVVLLTGDLPAYRDMLIGEDTFTVSNPLDGTITWVAEAGTVIQQGDVLYRVDDQPVVALCGARPAYRSIGGTPDLDVAAAEANLASAQAHLQELLALPDPEAVRIAEVQLTDAEIQLQLAQGAYDSVSWRPEISMLPQSFQLQAATNAYEIAKAQYDQAVEGATPAQIASAQAQVAQAQAALDALTSGPPLTHSGDDVRQLEEALVALGYDAGGALAAGDEFSPAAADAIKAWQAEIGAHVDGVVDFGEVVFLPGPAQVFDVLAQPGSQAGSVMQLATGDPASGADIQQLEEALLALGYDAGGTLVVDGLYTLETTQAVLAFQEATGLEQDGIIDLGEVIFLPGAVRITNQMVLKGRSVGAGATVFDVTLTERVVAIALPVDQQGLLAAGDPVTVELPDSTLISATVTSISQSATPSASGAAFFEAQAALDDPGAVDGLDEAPVDVIAFSDAVTDVMAAPVSALVALLEGGYAVERDAGGGNVQLVAVDVGFFGSNNLVQITSDALQPGDRVVVP